MQLSRFDCWEIVQIEREREEHLLPRLADSPEPEPLPPAAESAQALELYHSNGPVFVVDQQTLPRMALTMHPVEPIRIAPEPVLVGPEPTYGSVCSSTEPSENSKQEFSVPAPVVSEDSMSGLSQNATGVASREEQQQAKLGFSGLKLGKFCTVDSRPLLFYF